MEFTINKNEFLNETLYTADHKSGLRVMVLKKEGYQKSYAVISTKYGSVDSEFKTSHENEFTKVPDGIAHFLEHKLFEEEGGGNAFDFFSKTGASANAYTSFNNTAYLFSCTSDFNSNLEHLLSFVSKPYFTDENVTKEQGIIGQEIKMYEDDPEWRVFFNLLDCLYVNHPLKKDIAGTMESISKIDKDILYKCYNTFYHPKNMVLIITGDVDLDEVSEIIDKNVPVRDTEFDVIRSIPNEPKEINKKRNVQKLSVSTPIFSLGFKDADIGTDSKTLSKNNLLTTIILKIFASDSSPLYNKLYSEGLINDSFYTDTMTYKDYSMVQFGGETKDPDKVYEIILDEIKSVKEQGISEADFNRIKKNTYGKYVKSFNSIESVSNSAASNYFLNIGIFDFLDLYDQITLKDVQDRFNALFDEKYSAISIVEPV